MHILILAQNYPNRIILWPEKIHRGFVRLKKIEQAAFYRERKRPELN